MVLLVLTYFLPYFCSYTDHILKADFSVVDPAHVMPNMQWAGPSSHSYLGMSYCHSFGTLLLAVEVREQRKIFRIALQEGKKKIICTKFGFWLLSWASFLDTSMPYLTIPVTLEEHEVVGLPCICLVLYELQLKHLWATMWNCTWEFTPQSLHSIHTWFQTGPQL